MEEEKEEKEVQNPYLRIHVGRLLMPAGGLLAQERITTYLCDRVVVWLLRKTLLTPFGWVVDFK